MNPGRQHAPEHERQRAEAAQLAFAVEGPVDVESRGVDVEPIEELLHDLLGVVSTDVEICVDPRLRADRPRRQAVELADEFDDALERVGLLRGHGADLSAEISLGSGP